MRRYLKNIDIFSRNVILVFLGSSFVNFLNLLYQFLIAHQLEAADFAAFNALLSVYMLFSAPLGTLQLAITKYIAEFKAHGQIHKIKFLLSDILKKSSLFALLTLILMWFISGHIINSLKISSFASGYILIFLVSLIWITPIISGGVQGLEIFHWFTAASVISGSLKLLFAFLFIALGYGIAGALGALLFSGIGALIINYLPLRKIIDFNAAKENISYKQMLGYLLPVAVSNFCFIVLVSFDMVLVKYFFNPHDSGLYSLAQMVGKIFLFLPGAISLVMFPRISGLNAKKMDTFFTLKRSLWYAVILCSIAAAFYNIFPAFVLKLLTGKVYAESVTLGRLFSISMTFFALLYILAMYFLSLKDLRFIKWLVLFSFLQCLAIIIFHQTIFNVQFILCVSSASLFLIYLFLALKKKQ